MSGPKRNADKLNTIGVVVVGICGAVLVYVTIVALQAFYMNDTSEIQTMADYGGQDVTAKTHKAAEMGNITDYGKNATGTFHVPIEQAMKGVVESAKTDPAHLIPALPPQTKPTIEPVFGRPKPLAPPAPPPAAPAAGSGSAAGSAAQGGTTAAPMVTTGTKAEPQPVAGAGGQVTAPKKEPAKAATPPAKSPTPPPPPKGSNGK